MSGPYSIIYADPPWLFRSWSDMNQTRAAANHYSTMRAHEIRALPMEDMAAKNCALFLWVVQPNLPEAIKLIDAWGFTFKTVAFSWVKLKGKESRLFYEGSDVKMGMGYHTRSGFEQCWLATRGNGYRRLTKREPQVLFAPLREHSRKPDEIAEAIVRLCGDVPRAEAFARTTRPGWDQIFSDQPDKFQT